MNSDINTTRLTSVQLIGFLDTSYQSPVAMKKAAVVFRNQGPEAASRVLGVRGFDKLNKTRRDAFAGRNADRLAAFTSGGVSAIGDMASSGASGYDVAAAGGYYPSSGLQTLISPSSNGAGLGVTPWWTKWMNSGQTDAVPAQKTSSMSPFGLGLGVLDLGWDPMNGRHMTTKPSSFPKLFDGGGYVEPIDPAYTPQDTQFYDIDSPEATWALAKTVGDYARETYRDAQISGKLGWQPEKRNLPKATLDIMQNDIMGRAIMAHDKEGIAFSDKQRLLNAPTSWYYRAYPESLYVAAGKYKPGKGGTLGFVNPSNPNFISVNGRVRNPETKTLSHEGRHLYQINGLRLTPKQQQVIESAYDKGFLDLPFYKWYNHRAMMAGERETTNLDARNALLRALGKGSLIGKGYKVQNPVIQNASWEQILNAVSKANGYGSEYIKHLRNLYKNDTKKLKDHAERFRQAMMYVAMNDNLGGIPDYGIDVPDNYS